MDSGILTMGFLGNIGVPEGLIFLLFGPLGAWSLAWRAVAVWKAARRNHQAWFVILSIITTAGILDIIYIFAVAKGRDDGSTMATEASRAG